MLIKSNSLFVVLYGFLLAAFSTTLPTVRGKAISIRAGIPGFRIRGNNNNNDDALKTVEEHGLTDRIGSKSSFLLSVRRKGWFREFFEASIIPKLRTNSSSSSEHQQQQQQYHQHGFPLAGWILAAGSIGPFGRGAAPRNNIIDTVLQHPRWILAGGVVYFGQKAFRSETVRRATRFWWRIGPLVAHYKFTKWWLSKTGAPLDKRNAIYEKLHATYAPVAKAVALDLKGIYVKIAQVVSSRPDFIPLAYIGAFVDAQDSLPQWPIEDVKQLIDENLQTLSPVLSFEEVFEDIDDIALGTACIGQCHNATIKGKYAKELLGIGGSSSSSSGENSNDDDEHTPSVSVAVKVMHPGAEERFRNDFLVCRWLSRLALDGWEPIMNELYSQFMSEFDYREEAKSLDIVRSNMHKSPFHRSVKVPKPLFGLCSKELLVMELLDGNKLSESLEDELSDILGADRSKKLLDRKRLELVLGKDKLRALDALESSSSSPKNTTTTTVTEESVLEECGWATKLRLLGLFKRAQRKIDMLVDVQGYQILKDGVFQGDPHPGNILELRKSKSGGGGITSFYRNNKGSLSSLSLLGLIDYGQTKYITDEERLGLARVILTLEETDDDLPNTKNKTELIANAMRDLGFATKRDDSGILEKYAYLFFDSDDAGKFLYECATPQNYFEKLTELDPLVSVPDVAVFVYRCGFILRGMGSILGKQIKTAHRWSVYAKQALEEVETE